MSGAKILGEVAAAMRTQQREKEREKASEEGLAPTEQQLARFNFKHGSINEGTVLVGRAYRRRPLFETMFRRDEIDADILEALRYYRNAYENADRSEVRSVLNRDPGGTGDGPGLALIMARETRDDCEAAIPAFLIDTLRAVALHDRTFVEIARDRWAAPRERARQFAADDPRDGKVVRLLPPSGRQRAKIAAEFKAGAYALHTFVAPRISTTDGRKKHVAGGAAAC